MSYGMTAELQAAVFATLQGDAALEAVVGGAIYDALPDGAVPALFVSLGPEKVRDASDKIAGAALHDFSVSVISDAAGFQSAKQAAAAVSDAVLGAELALGRGQVARLSFLKARAVKNTAGRRIDIWFRALLDDG